MILIGAQASFLILNYMLNVFLKSIQIMREEWCLFLHFSGRRGLSVAGAAAPGAWPLQNQLDNRAATQGGQELRAGRLHIAIGAGHRELGAEQTLVLERRQH